MQKKKYYAQTYFIDKSLCFETLQRMDVAVFKNKIKGLKVCPKCLKSTFLKFINDLRGLYTITNYFSVCQRTEKLWHSLAYAEVRLHIVFNSFLYVKIRSRTLLFAPCVVKFCACTNIFNVCQRTARTQRGSSVNAIRTVWSSVIRQR